MPKKNTNNQVTKRDLESLETRFDKKMEKAMGKQTKVILKALDFGFNGVKADTAIFKENVNNRMDKTEANIVELKKKADKSLTQQDNICKQLSDIREENKMNFNLYKRHDEKIEDHEQRINNLEIQPAK